MADNPYRLGKRELQADFDPGPFANISLVRRPGAISLDYQTCFTLGPKAAGDSSLGPVDRAWKIRYNAATLTFYGAPANDTNTAWQAEVLLFVHVGAPFEEIDASFDQSAHIVVCGQRAGHIWVYYYDGFVGGFTFVDFGLGRTPKVVLDNPIDTANSDVVIFFLDDIANRLRYLLQRDRYLVRYDTPVVGILNSYIEDAIRSTDHRVHVYYTTRNDTNGSYVIQHLETTLYPYYILEGEDAVQPGSQFAPTSTLRTVLLFDVLNDIDAVTPSFEWPDDGRGTLRVVLIQHTIYDIDAAQPGFTFGDAFLETISAAPVISHTLFDKDAVQPGASFPDDGRDTLVVILFFHTLYDIDAAQPGFSFEPTSSLA